MSNVAELVAELRNLMDGPIKRKVDSRIKEFESVSDKFSEMCFCILTANSSAEMGIKIQKNLGNGFLNLSEDGLREELKKHGYRFPGRAEYICANRKYKDIDRILSSFSDERKAREWLVKNVKGFGYKEASHFLRNIGYKNVAIIDRHILRAAERYGIIKEIPKNLNKKAYLEIEKKIEKVANELGITLAELDLYLWYMETGKILK
ncbi:MAG TPA: N-glycosylase/DNA lyase [Thermoplasmatales archaeon]|nr:N-glycosylase/DNA lyase [Thermoplasmata archaeon]RLF45991.1 MAG: N-glycosylase [Thermoplasmata archaeon]HDH81631.1 N-glycosylase/DNA lyase [Thermoplasmatales archaeon]